MTSFLFSKLTTKLRKSQVIGGTVLQHNLFEGIAKVISWISKEKEDVKAKDLEIESLVYKGPEEQKQIKTEKQSEPLLNKELKIRNGSDFAS